VVPLWVSQVLDSCREKCRKHRHTLQDRIRLKKAPVSFVTYSDLRLNSFGKRGALSRTDLHTRGCADARKGVFPDRDQKGDAR
jgi:hypothetical protein